MARPSRSPRSYPLRRGRAIQLAREPTRRPCPQPSSSAGPCVDAARKVGGSLLRQGGQSPKNKPEPQASTRHTAPLEPTHAPSSRQRHLIAPYPPLKHLSSY